MTMPVSPAKAAVALTAQPLSIQAGRPQDDLAGAARQFEAIFVRQMLAAARKTDLGGADELFGGQGMDTFRQMQDERFADLAADRGMLGIARLLEGRLAPASSAATAKG